MVVQRIAKTLTLIQWVEQVVNSHLVVGSRHGISNHRVLSRDSPELPGSSPSEGAKR